MDLTQSTIKILKTVEELSGSPVVLKNEPNLPTLTKVVRAGAEVNFHQILYRNEGSEMNYLVSYQASFLVRLYSLPLEERWHLVCTDEEKENAVRGFELEDLPINLAYSLIDSLLIQLRSSILGLQIDESIINNCPDLKAGQKSSVSGQLKDNLNCLSPDVRGQFPKALVDPNTTMNAVYAKFWAEKHNDPKQLIPYTSLGYNKVVNELYDVFLDSGDHPSNDRDLVNQWAKILKLNTYCHTETF